MRLFGRRKRELTVGASEKPDGPGYLRGRRPSDYPDDVARLERQGKLKEAEDLLLELVEVVENESRVTGMGVAPWCYERLATIYRNQCRYEEEIAILERYANQRHAPGGSPAKLLLRLEKAKHPSRRRKATSHRRRSAVGSADEFLFAIRTARHYDGRPVVNDDAPLRTRRGAPTYKSLAAPVPIPALESGIFVGPPLDDAQESFYEAWRSAFEAGEVWSATAREERRLTAYGLTYARDLITEARSDPGATAIHLEILAAAYPHLRDHVVPWACDAWLLAGDMRGALDCEPPHLGHISGVGTSQRLTLKYHLGAQLDAWELFALYPPKVTAVGRERMDALVALVQSRLDADHRAGTNYLDELFFNRRLGTSGWPLWNESLQVVITAAPYGRLYKLGAGRELAAKLERAAENALREDIGLPRVGQGWVGETQLFVELRDALDTEVIQHGVPDGFGRQHLDVWIPAWRVGVEYQGLQHSEPLEFFGGEEALAATIERDRLKRSKAERLNIKLIYVEAGYDLDEVIAHIEAARVDP
jgi:hypothetical protein